MASPVEICNSALIKLGVEPIVSLDDDVKAARLCKEQYPKIRDCLLESHFWNFAMKRSDELAEDSTPPNFGFARAYVLPVDCLRVLHMNENRLVRFKIESNRRLLTNKDGARILYISREEDVSKYSSTFKEALAYKLAVDLAYPLIQSVSLAEKLNKKADIVLRDARSFDGQEGTLDELEGDVWLKDRLGDPTGDFVYDDQV